MKTAHSQVTMWQRLLRWWVRLQRRVDVPGLTLLTVTLMGFGIFSLKVDTIVVCALLMIPITVLALVRGWVAGILVAMVVSLLIVPNYFGVENTLIHDPSHHQLDPHWWLALTAGYLVLGALVGLRGNYVRRRQAAVVEEMEARLQRAQASAQRYEALLEEMSQGQEHLIRMNEELALLNGIATAVNSSLDMGRIMDSTMTQLGSLLKVDQLCVYWLSAGDILVLEAARPTFEEVGAYAGRLGEGVIGRALQAQQPVCLDADDGIASLPGMNDEINTLVLVPLRMGARLLGVLALGRRGGEAFTEDDANFLGSLARVLSLAIENAKLFERAQELSLSDELTGLANRRLFNLRLGAEIARSQSHGVPLCLVIFDLDFFKRVNDQYGHPAGDDVLRQFAKLVQQDIRGADLFCRIGGEEFALLATDAVLLETYAIAQRVCRHLRETPLALEDGTMLTMTVSAGVAVLDDTVTGVEDFIAAADHALYTAKSNGRNRVEVYTSDMALFATPPGGNGHAAQPVSERIAP